MTTRRLHRGFTLIEVMVGLSLLGLALVVLIKSSANSIFHARQAQMMSVATDLSRSKMHDIEEMLLKEGFMDTEQVVEDEDFDDEGWPTVTYSYKVEPVELPSIQDLQALAEGRAAAGSGSAGSAGSGADGEEGTGEPASLGLLSQLGGFGEQGGEGMTADAQMGASVLQTFYPFVQEILKVSIRRVTLTVKYEVMGRDRELTTVAFFTDAAAMDKVLMGFGSQEQPEPGASPTPNPNPNPNPNPREPRRPSR